MMRRKYNDEEKAAVKAALLAGQSVSSVAKEYKIPKGTVSNWKNRPKSGTQKSQENIGELIVNLLASELNVLENMVHTFSNPKWLEKQNASDAAVLYGVIQDKAIRKLEAMSASTDSNTES